MCEKFCAWSDGIKGVGDPPFSFDDILTEIMIFLTTRTFATASWLYRGFFEEAQPCVPAGMRLTLPVGVANFPHDLLNFPPREMVERSYNVQHWRDMPRGGHFAAWEEPELFIEELQTFVSLLTN
jgi:microsomal epoxide hydrolase